MFTFPVPGGPNRSIPDVKLRPRIPYEKMSGRSKVRLMDVCNVSMVAAGAHISSKVVFMRAVMEGELILHSKKKKLSYLSRTNYLDQLF